MASRPDAEHYDLHAKLLMLGDTGVGKTCLLLRFCHDSFSPTFITTIGIDFKIKYVTVNGVCVKLQIWDTAGQERFRTLTISYFKGAHGVVLVYDVTDRDSFENIEHWISQIKSHADSAINLVLVGNKADMPQEQRAVSPEEGQALAQKYGARHFETSAKNNQGVEECFDVIAAEVTQRLRGQEAERQRHQTEMIDLQASAQNTKRKSCC